MITHPIYGGLGNQLYQIFTVIALAIRAGDTCVFHRKPQPPTRPGHIEASGVATRIMHWDTIFSKLAPYMYDTDPCEDPTLNRYRYSQPSHAYTPIGLPHTSKSDTLYALDGYFQSYKYFGREFDTICKHLDIEGQRKCVAEWVRSHPALGRIVDPDTKYQVKVAMHFRIGDYKTLSHNHPVLTAAYYERALTALLDRSDPSSEIHVFLFYDTLEEPEVTPIVDHLRRRIVCPPTMTICYHHVPPQITTTHLGRALTDPEHLLLMSMCTHFIIANSTFSLWAAYFSNYFTAGPEVFTKDISDVHVSLRFSPVRDRRSPTLDDLLSFWPSGENLSESTLLPKRPDSALVYYPSVWFGVALQSTHYVGDMFPKAWKRIEA
jgi:hypothetical protein